MRRRLRWIAIFVSAGIAVLGAGCGTSSHPDVRAVATTTTTQTRLEPPSSGDWLGLNYDSSSGTGDITDFSRYGIVYDRLGPFDLAAGVTVQSSRRLAQGLRASIHAGMVPDVVIGPVLAPSGCSTNPNTTDRCLPDTPVEADAYVTAFLKTVLSIRRAYPHQRFLFEPMDEPWDWAAPPNTASGIPAAEEYGAVLARLLPAVRSAGIPLSSIYVPAVGVLADSTSWVPDLYRAAPCLEPGPRSCGPIEGWNLHPYGPTRSTAHGIGGVPAIRAQMRSGENNIVISEIGFCARNVLGGASCGENTPTVVGSSAQTAEWLTAALRAGLRMHREGWLRAMIIWERADGGWSMQLPDGRLTAQGRALIRFARAQSEAR